MFDRLYYQDIKINEIQNYSRRENIEIHNISENVLQSNLENYVIEIMASLNIKISSYGIVAVHRIGKKTPEKPRPVIVRFINRKNAYIALHTGYKLKKVTNAEFHNFFITENLCSESRNIFNRLYKYKKFNKLFNVWSYNGTVYFKYQENNDSIKIVHYDDIEYYFDKMIITCIKIY